MVDNGIETAIKQVEVKAGDRLTQADAMYGDEDESQILGILLVNTARN